MGFWGWQFMLGAPTERHRLALAARFPGGEPAQVRIVELVPGAPGSERTRP